MLSAFFGGHNTHVRHSILNARTAFYSLFIFLVLTISLIISLLLPVNSSSSMMSLQHFASLSSQQWIGLPQLEQGTTISATLQPALTPISTSDSSNMPLPFATLWGNLTTTPAINLTTAVSDASPIETASPVHNITSTIPLSQTPTITLMPTYTSTLGPSATPTMLLTSTDMVTSTAPTLTVVPTQTTEFTPTIVATLTAIPMPTVIATYTTAIDTITPIPTYTIPPLPTAILTKPMTATPTSVPIPSITPSSMATIVPPTTPIPNKTNTSTDASNGTPIATPEPTELSGVAQSACEQDAMEISTDGTIRSQQLDALDNSSWLYFEAEANVDYQIEASLYSGVEVAGMKVELYKSCDPPLLIDSQSITVSQKIRLIHRPTTTGHVYLKVIDANAEDNLDNLSKKRPYELSIYSMDSPPEPGVLVILGSRLEEGDKQQSNVNNLARQVYNMYLDAYSAENIKLFIDDPGPSINYSENITLPSKSALQNAIITWTKTFTDEHQSFTLYMVGHANTEHFYIDKPNEESLTPEELNSWLTDLEDDKPVFDINVIIESSNSGIFMGSGISDSNTSDSNTSDSNTSDSNTSDSNRGISKQGRVIITSTDANSHAYSTRRGAIFSDFFFRQVNRGATLLHSYMNGIRVAQQARDWQRPGLDADGDGTPNTTADYVIASKRGQLYAFPDEDTPASLNNSPSWSEPTIVNTDGTGIENDVCIIKAIVKVEPGKICRVWSIIREPGFAMPPPSASFGIDTYIGVHTLEIDLCTGLVGTNVLIDQGNDRYEGEYSCKRKGKYHVAIYAADNTGEEAEVKKRSIINPGTDIYLPIILK